MSEFVATQAAVARAKARANKDLRNQRVEKLKAAEVREVDNVVIAQPARHAINKSSNPKRGVDAGKRPEGKR